MRWATNTETMALGLSAAMLLAAFAQREAVRLLHDLELGGPLLAIATSPLLGWALIGGLVLAFGLILSESASRDRSPRTDLMVMGMAAMLFGASVVLRGGP